MKRWTIIPTAAVAIALAISGALLLAGGESGSALAEAGERIEGQSMRMNLKLSMTIPEGRMHMTGSALSTADGSAGTMKVTIEMEGEPLAVPMDLVVIRDDMWMHSTSFKRLLPRGKTWVHGVDRTSAPETLTPAEYSRFFARADDVSVVDDDAPIRGKPTTYYKGLIDVKEIAEEVGGETEERLDRLLGDRTIRVPVEAWIGRDGLPARIGLDVNQDGQSFKMTADILEYGVPVDVKPPAEEATIEEAEFDRLTGG
jgi:hypothetical protein